MIFVDAGPCVDDNGVKHDLMTGWGSKDPCEYRTCQKDSAGKEFMEITK